MIQNIPGAQIPLRFDGPAYSEPLDQERLTGQILVIFDLMRDARWRTLQEISQKTGYGEASVSAQLRNLRKARFGSHRIDKRRVIGGLWEYRLLVTDH